MTLTYPGAELYVEKIHDALRLIYPSIPPCMIVWDEPSGDFGIAHFYGLDGAGASCAAKLSFDDNRVPLRYTITHELGHALSASVSVKRGGNGFTDGMYDEFWAARGWVNSFAAPATPWAAQQIAIAKEIVAVNSGYRDWPEENFADTFGVVNTPYAFPITEQWGVYLDQAKMIEFYKGLVGEDFMSQTEIEAGVVAYMTSFGLDAPTFKFIKERLGIDAHHKHKVTTSNGQATDMGTTEPIA